MPPQQMLHKNSDQHARSASSSIQISTDSYNLLKTELAAAKGILMEQLRKRTAAKLTIRVFEGENRKPVIQAQISLLSKMPLVRVVEIPVKSYGSGKKMI